MGNTWVTDLRHFIDENGGFPPGIPGPARKLAEYLASIVQVASAPVVPGEERVSIQCRRRPGRRRCPGVIRCGIQADTRVTWECPTCGDNGFIAHWQGTAWDRSPYSQLH